MLLEKTTSFIIIDKAIHNTINIILNKWTKAGLRQGINRWLMTVFRDSVARATIAWQTSVLVGRAKNDANNPKKEGKQNQELKGFETLRYTKR